MSAKKNTGQVSPRGHKGKLFPSDLKEKLTSKQKEHNRALNAVKNAKLALGEERFLSLRAEWKRLDTVGVDRDKADGMIMSLLRLELSKRMIIAVFSCGSSRVMRIKREMMDPQVKKRVRKPPYHAVTETQKLAIKEHINSYETEDGFPCAHRRPRKYFVKQGLTWSKVHET